VAVRLVDRGALVRARRPATGGDRPRQSRGPEEPRGRCVRRAVVVFQGVGTRPPRKRSPGQPQGEHGLQPHRPGIARGLPDRGQRLDPRGPLRGRPATPPGGVARAAGRGAAAAPTSAESRSSSSPHPGSVPWPGERPAESARGSPAGTPASHGRSSCNPPPARGPSRVTSPMARAPPLGNILDGAIRRLASPPLEGLCS
jgi:hypothetical protein